MISREEIETLARLNRVRPYFQEKHYLMSLVLSSLYSQVSDELVFKGGTYLWFFHKLPRASEDLDFTAVADIDMDRISETVVDDLAAYGIKVVLTDKTGKVSYTTRLAIEGPIYDGRNRNHIRLDVSMRGDLSRRPRFVAFRSPYSEVPDFTLLGMDMEEVLAEKIRAMLWRRRARDLFDVHHLIGLGVEMDTDLVRSKLAYYDLEPGGELLGNAMADIEDAWRPELSPLIRGGPPGPRTAIEEVEAFLGGVFG